MTILSAQSIYRLCNPIGPPADKAPMIQPFSKRTKHSGMTFGLSACGYDIRLAEGRMMYPSSFRLGVSMEQFTMPENVMGLVKDKSSLARRGISVYNTVIEPGWRGFLTLEIVNHDAKKVFIPSGAPIAQIIFQWLDMPTTQPYDGKYQDQLQKPQEAISE